MWNINFEQIITEAWKEYDRSKDIVKIVDVSARVSTNHVFKVIFKNRAPVYAKLSYYGKFDHFREDHVIINNLANNIESPYENFLARSLTKNNDVYIYRYSEDCNSAWVVFYNPIKIKNKMPRRLEESHIRQMGKELALFHRACTNVEPSLPESSKTLHVDVNSLIVSTHSRKKDVITENRDIILSHCDKFIAESGKLEDYGKLDKIPVFVDWNIGNYSVAGNGKFYSRWDYDWFRIANRVMDFYFFSRVVSDAGDKTAFSYWMDTLMEDRFILFLKEYHKTFPLAEVEVLFIKEAYRFFILNYVMKDGEYFFCDKYARKLQMEAIDYYLPSIDKKFSTDRLLKALDI